MVQDGGSFASYTPGSDATVISVTAQGVKPNDPSAASANTSKIKSLISNAKANTVIDFPKGTYYISTGFSLSGKSRLCLRGNGSTLIATSYAPAKNMLSAMSGYNNSLLFQLSNCSGVTIEGFTLDFQSHTACDGEITAVSGSTTTFRAYDEFLFGKKTPVAGGELVASASLFDANGNLLDGEAYLSTDTSNIKTLTKVSSDTFSIPVKLGAVGQHISVRLAAGAANSPMFYGTGNQNMTFRNLTVRSNPSAVFYLPSSNRDFCFDGITVAPAASSKQLFGSNEDVIHVKGMRGKLVVKNCTFKGLGDDALNVHARVSTITAVSGTTVTGYNKFDNKSLDSTWAAKGDTIAFYNSGYVLLGTGTVTSFSSGKVTVDTLPAGVSTSCFMINLTNHPEVWVSNCTVERGRARGFLIQTPNAVIQNCTFSNLRLPAILVSPDFDQWYEGGFTANLLIRDCTFQNCMRAGWLSSFGAITINECSEYKKLMSSTARGHGDIVITGNTFTNGNSYGIYAHSVRKLQMASNTVSGGKGLSRTVACN